jgi:hypothetical protein
MSKRIYRYSFPKFSENAATIGSNPLAWVEKIVNEIGAAGNRVVGWPQEFVEPGNLTDAAGNPIPRLGITVMVEEDITPEDEE